MLVALTGVTAIGVSADETDGSLKRAIDAQWEKCRSAIYKNELKGEPLFEEDTYLSDEEKQMSPPVARILHLNFKKAQDCELWLFKNEKDAKELEKGSLQRSIVKVDDKSLIILSFFQTEKDAETVFARFGKWSNSFMSFTEDVETLTIIGDVEYNAIYY